MLQPLIVLALVPDWITNWYTPIWILSAGVTSGLFALTLLWVLIAAFSRRWATELLETSTEGVLQWVGWLGLTLVVIFLAGLFIARDPRSLVSALPRLWQAGPRSFESPIPAADLQKGVHENPAIEIPGPFVGSEFKDLTIVSDVGIIVAAEPLKDDRYSDRGGAIEVKSDAPLRFVRTVGSETPWGNGRIDRLYVYSLADVPGSFRLNAILAPPHDVEAKAIPITAICTIVFVLCFWALCRFAPQVAAIAHTTAKSEMAQPLFGINLLLGAFLLVLFIFIPYNTLGEDIKMLKDSGFAALMILGIIQAAWGASMSVFDEVEGRTALTVLSKPIGRRQFILGKFLGIVSLVSLMFVLLGFLFLVVVAYKPIYDARENSELAATWETCFNEVRLTMPGLVLAFMEVVVLAGVSVAISTRLPVLVNFIVCATIYVLGHLTPLIVQSSIASFEPVVFVGTLIATLIPVLDHFNVQAAVAAGVEVPSHYLWLSFLYCVLYSAVSMLLALALFEDRDLA